MESHASDKKQKKNKPQLLPVDLSSSSDASDDGAGKAELHLNKMQANNSIKRSKQLTEEGGDDDDVSYDELIKYANQIRKQSKAATQQVVQDSEDQDEDESDGLAGEEGEFEIEENESGEGEELSSSEDELDLNKIVNQRKANKQIRKEMDSEEDEEEELKEDPEAVAISKKNRAANGVKVLDMKKKKSEKGEIEVDFEMAQPSEAYYHQVKALLNQYIDGEEAEKLDMVEFTEYICERASIGQMVVSPLEPSKDPELMPEFQNLSDEEFAKRSLKYYSERDVFAFSTIISLNYDKRKGRKERLFITQLKEYIIKKAEKFASKKFREELQRILETKNVGLLLAERMLNLPANLVPAMHTELPDDIAFTREQDDVEDPREFDYQYFLVMSKFTLPVKSKDGVKIDEKAIEERRYYKWEDEILLPASDTDFTFLSTFSYVDDDGKKKTFTGSKDGKEVQYRLVYLISYQKYLQEIQKLSQIVNQ